jgi:hypothetical protein
MELFESNISLNVYRKLLHILGDYSCSFPGTGVGKLFKQATEQGKKILPSDKLALKILWTILSKETSGSAVHKLLNMRFSNLPPELQPIVKKGRAKEVAFWSRGASVTDRIKDLIDFEGDGKKGTWSDMDGNKVTLLDITVEEK